MDLQSSRLEKKHGHGHGKLLDDEACDSGFGDSYPLREEEECLSGLTQCLSLEDKSSEAEPSSYESSESSEYIARGEYHKSPFLSEPTNNTSNTDSVDHSPQGSTYNLLRQIFSQDEDGDTYAHLAVCQGKEEMAHSMINLASSLPKILNIQNKLGQTCLQLAAYMNFTSIIRRLIDCGVDVDLPDNKGQTVVHISAERDNYEALKEIYTVTPYFNQGLVHSLTRLLEVKNYQGLTPLQWAVKHKSTKVAQTLVQIGANINSQDSKHGYTALHHAVLSGDITLVEFLISTCNPDLNSLSYTGVTPLILAKGNGKEQITALLIAAGADTDRETWEGDSWDSLSSSG